jgi:hypothetical protein
LYLVRLMLPEKSTDATIDDWLCRDFVIKSRDEAERGFIDFIDLVGPCHWDYEHFMQEGCALRDGLIEYAKEALREGYETLGPYLPWVFRTVGAIHRNYVDAAVPTKSRGPEADIGLAKLVNASFDQGRPVLRCRLNGAGIATAEKGDLPSGLDDPWLDPLYLITRCLSHYILTVKRAIGKQLLLDRVPDGNAIRFPPGDREWYEYLIDRGAAAMFCPVPEARQTRTRKQIALRKTMRDIAATLHGRRLYRIIVDTLMTHGNTASQAV